MFVKSGKAGKALKGEICMRTVEIPEEEFDKLMERLDKIEMDKDDYIPSEDDVFDYIEKHPERYYLYLLWYSEHKPKPQTEEEKKILKRVTKIINNTIVIV